MGKTSCFSLLVMWEPPVTDVELDGDEFLFYGDLENEEYLPKVQASIEKS
jgi:hypothetical protein